MNKILSVNNLNKSYFSLNGEILAIENVSFNVNDNDFIAIVGPSGCGKSTLLSILASLEEYNFGNIEYYKKDIEIGYMLQQDCLFDHLTILDNCLIGLKIKKKLTKENKEYVIKLLNTYGLKDFIYKYPKNLSGGMKQRVV